MVSPINTEWLVAYFSKDFISADIKHLESSKSNKGYQVG